MECLEDTDFLEPDKYEKGRGTLYINVVGEEGITRKDQSLMYFFLFELEGLWQSRL